MNTVEKKVSHTPGQWEISETFAAFDGEDDILIEHQGCPICTVRGTNDMSCIDEDDQMAICDEVMANAKLIAAAPELLEALQTMLGVYSPYGKGDSQDRGIALQKAELAIKKAIS